MLGALAKILGSGDVISQGMKLIDDMHTSDDGVRSTRLGELGHRRLGRSG